MRKWLAFYFIAVLLLLTTVSASAYQLTIPEKTQVIEDEAFMNDTSLSVVVLPSKMISIGNKAFYGCKLSEVYMPDEIDYIADNAFGGNNGMTVYALPGSYAYQWAKQKGFTVDDPTPIVTGGFETNSLTVQCGNAINVKFNATCRFGYFHFLYLYIDSNYYQIDLPACEKYSNYIEIPLDKLNDSLEHEVEIFATYLDLDGYERGTTWLDSLHVTQTVDDTEPSLVGGFTVGEIEVEQGAPIYLPIELTCQNGLINDIYVSSDFDYSWWLGLPSPVSTYSGEINIPLDQLRDQLNHSVSIFVVYSSLDGNQQYSQWTSSIEITQTASGQEEQDDIIYPDSILLDQHEMVMKIGDRKPNPVSLPSPSDISPEATAITWISSDTTIATVSNGIIEAKTVGSAVITAQTVNGLCDYCLVTVEPDTQITGGFDEESICIFVPNHEELRYHVNVKYGTLKNVKLKYGSRYLLTHDYTEQTTVSSSFTITTGTNGIIDSTGKKTVSLIATAMDGTEVELGTASIYVKYDYPTRVTGISASYLSGKIRVYWDNNGDATRYTIMYVISGDVNVYSVKVNDPDATGGTITGVTAGKVYDIYVVAYNENGSGYSPRSEVVQVMTSDDSTPAVSARFARGQTVYAPGETINIEINYGNVAKIHYQNYDNDYNPNGGNTSNYNGDYPNENGWNTNKNGTITVQLVAQSTPGNYCVEIFARNAAGTAATHSYNYTMNTGARCLMMTYTVQTGGLAAPTWSDITPKSTVKNVYFFSEVPRATGYRVYRSATSDPSQAELIGTLKAPPFENNEPTGISYYFVQATNSYGYGPMSTWKRIELQPNIPTITAYLVKSPNSTYAVYKPGEDIMINISYSNIKKVHYSNGDNKYNPYSLEQNILHSGDIWADDVAQEDADFNISDNSTVKLKAQMTPGNYHIQIWAKNKDNSPATSSYDGKQYYELTYTVSSSPITSEGTYYENLHLVPDGKNAFDYIPDLYEYLITELGKNGISESKAKNIVNHVKSAPQIYRDLYLWSFFNYSLQFSNTDASWFSFSDKTMYIEDTASIATWFHEAGHAVDYTSSGSWLSSSKYRDILFKALEDRIRAEVQILISRKDEDGNYQLTENEKNEVGSCIMGPSYFIVPHQFLTVHGYSTEAPGWLNDNQKAVFDAVVKELQTRANNRDLVNDEMYIDMLSGFTNNVGTYRGHGPTVAYECEKYKNIRNKDGNLVFEYDYWYNGSGGPTYMQNLEAWAEFYSSMFTKGENNINTSEFPAACFVMENMAKEMLEICKSNH